MLAQNFKTAADLGISDVEQGALVKVLGMLERDELPHNPDVDDYTPNGFRMSGYRVDTDCGTVACIAGWVSIVLGRSRDFAPEFADRTDAIRELCHASSRMHLLSTITPAQAATALRSYLTTGDANWAEALA